MSKFGRKITLCLVLFDVFASLIRMGRWFMFDDAWKFNEIPFTKKHDPNLLLHIIVSNEETSYRNWKFAIKINMYY